MALPMFLSRFTAGARYRCGRGQFLALRLARRFEILDAVILGVLKYRIVNWFHAKPPHRIGVCFQSSVCVPFVPFSWYLRRLRPYLVRTTCLYRWRLTHRPEEMNS